MSLFAYILNSTVMKSFCFGIICLFCFFTGYGQAGRPMSMPRSHVIVVPRPTYYTIPVTYQLHDGIARLTDGSLLQGRFMYKRGNSFTFYQDGHSPGKQIPSYLFDNLVLAGADTAATPRSDSTIFIRINNNLLRRLTKGKVGLYDKTYAVNEDKGKIGDVLFTWSNEGKLRRLRTLEEANQWFYEICLQNHWPNPDVFLSKSDIIKRLAQLDPTP